MAPPAVPEKKKSPYVPWKEPDVIDLILEQVVSLCEHYQDHRDVRCQECLKYLDIEEVLKRPWKKPSRRVISIRSNLRKVPQAPE